MGVPTTRADIYNVNTAESRDPMSSHQFCVMEYFVLLAEVRGAVIGQLTYSLRQCRTDDIKVRRRTERCSAVCCGVSCDGLQSNQLRANMKALLCTGM